MPCLNLKISGKVQGVGFRYSIKQWADRNNIFGFVKNLSDQKVLVEMNGEIKLLKNFLKWLNFESGFKIINIEQKWSEIINSNKNFQIIE